MSLVSPRRPFRGGGARRDERGAGRNPDTSGSGLPGCGQRLPEAISGGGRPTPLRVRGSGRSPEPPRAGQQSPTFSMKGRKRVWAASQKQFHLKCYRKIIYGSFWKTQLSRSHALWVPDGRGSAGPAGACAAGARSNEDQASRAARGRFPQRMAGSTSGCSVPETHPAAPTLRGTCLHLHPRVRPTRPPPPGAPHHLGAPVGAPLRGLFLL